MPSQLDPLIEQQLLAFGRRWRRLVLLRGVCGGVITLLGAMTLVALADWLFLMPEGLRWGLSAAGYVATALVVWFVCLRQLLHRQDLRELARLVEKTRPELREDLLSAVELAQVQKEPQWDSETLRALVQENVAQRIRNLQVEKLLPRRLISLWLRAAGGTLAVCAVLYVLPGLHYPQLMVRAFAPMANVDRISNVKISILEPRPEVQWHPLGDNIPVVVKITGPEPSKVILETFGKDGSGERITMTPSGARQYTASLAMGAESVGYRIRAGDGITKKLALQSRPRPHVVKFDKTFHYPAYSRLKPRQVVEENGDLAELEDSEVELKLLVNQSIREGHLLVETRKETNSVPLTASGHNAMTARLPLRSSGVYRVLLVAAETGFENKFSPQYELRPLADLVPRIAITSPSQDSIVPPEEVVALQGRASDDIGLARLSQAIFVNEEPFGEVPLASDAGTNAAISRAWDLLQLSVNPGDRVGTKLVAIDLKGNRAESTTVTLLISSAGFDVRRLQILETRRALQEALVTLRNAALDLKKNLSSEALQRIRAGDELQRKQSLAGALTSFEEFDRQLDKIAGQIRETEKFARPGRDVAELALLGRAASFVRHEYLLEARADIELLARDTADRPNQNAVQEAAKTVSRVADQAAYLEALHRDLLASAETDAVVENVAFLSREQARMNREAQQSADKDSSAWERLARRSSGAVKEAAVGEDLLRRVQKETPRGTAERAGKLADSLKSVENALDKSINARKPDQQLLAATGDFQRGLEQALNEVRAFSHDLAQRADKSRDDLAKLAGTSAAKVERLRADLDEVNNLQRQLADAQRRRASTGKTEARLVEVAEKADAHWRSAVEQLKDRAGFEEMRKDLDAYFVADLTKTSQALAALRTAAGDLRQTNSFAAEIRLLEKSLRSLEAAHNLVEVHGDLRTLSQQERYEARAADAVLTRPRDWNWTVKGMTASPADLRKAALPETAARKVTEAAGSPEAKAIAAEMAARAASQRLTAAVPEKIETLQARIREALQEIEPLLAGARSIIDQSAPKLSQMMAGLAKSAREMERQTRQTLGEEKKSPAGKADSKPGEPGGENKADSAKSGEATDGSAPAAPLATQELLTKQENLNEQINDLNRAVRNDANVQDTSSAEGRERARDGDDAIAALREPPTRAEERLREATFAKDAEAQSAAMRDAAEQQGKLADTLEKLAQHYEKMEKGELSSEGRTALRKMEEELGLKSQLEEQFAMLEKLNEMSGESPQKMLERLEKELAQNPTMRQELTGIARDTLEGAHQTLDRMADLEKKIAEALKNSRDPQETLQLLTEQARRLARDAGKLGGENLRELDRNLSDSQTKADKEMEQAKRGLVNASEKADPDKADATSMARQLGEAAQLLNTAAKELKSAGDKAAKVARASEDFQRDTAEFAQAKAAQMTGQADKLAQEANRLSDQFRDLTQSSSRELAAGAADQQNRVASEVGQAGADIERSGRHQGRLGMGKDDSLQKIGRDTQQVANEKIPDTRETLEKTRNTEVQSKAVESAQQAVEQQKLALEKSRQQAAVSDANPPGQSPSSNPQMAGNQSAGQPSSKQPAGQGENQAGKQTGSPATQSGQNGQAQAQAGSQPSNAPSSAQAGSPAGESGEMGKGSTASPEDSKLMARSLDQLDAMLHPFRKPGQSPSGDSSESGSSEQQNASNVASNMQQAQKSAMAQARSQGKTPGEKSNQETEGDGEGSDFVGDRVGVKSLPQLRTVKEGDWGKLPPKLAQGLMEAQREALAAEYRNQVETYFKVIAERAKEKR